MAQIIIFGASTTYGLYDIEGGWATRLRKYLDEQYLDQKKQEHRVYNLAIDGTTTKQLLGQIEFETKQRLFESEDEGLILIISAGGNDSQFFNQKKYFRTSPELFGQMINKLFNITSKFTNKVIYLSPTPVDETKVDPIPWRPDRSYKNQYINKFTQIAISVFEKNGGYSLNLFDKLVQTDYKKLLLDGIHPNSEGHKKIFEIVRDFLMQNKFI